MASIVMAILATSVALGYFTIAVAVAPRIKMPSAGARVVFVIRCAAIAFFIGCGMTHVHILVHTLGYGTPMQVEAHELVFHSAQAIGAWLFIAGAILRLELHVVPSQTRMELEAAVEEQRLLTEEAQNLARRDELTGLARRWRFDEELARQAARARRHGTSAALILIDLDGLKAVNDTYGHQAGDSVLEHVAEVMRDELRGSDIAARIGGDEFALILDEAGIEEAEVVAKRIVASARRTATGLPETSVSVGVTPIARSLAVCEIMKHADDALYEAKRAGGDRCARSAPRSAHALGST